MEVPIKNSLDVMFVWMYYLVSVGLFGWLVRLCWPDQMAKWGVRTYGSDALFLGLALLLLTFMRLPTLFYNQELNPDESQLITQAITLLRDPVYGRSVDGTSIGPINSYLLLLPHFVGLPIDYVAARLVGLLLIGSSLLLFFRSLLCLTSPVVSRLTLLPALAFFGWTAHNDFLHFSSELSSLVIITACFLLMVKLLQEKIPANTNLALLGLLAGLTPYCKLQALPVVGMMLITLTISLLVRYRAAAVQWLAVAGVAFVVPTALVFGLGYVFGVDRYFVDYYFVGNLSTYSQIYANVPLVQAGFGAKLLRFPFFLARHTDFLLFILVNCLLVLALVLSMGWRAVRHMQPSWTTLLVGLTAAGAFWATITPGTEFGHHLLLLVFPLGWVMALGLQLVWQWQPDRQMAIRLAGLVGLLLLVEVLLTDNLLLSYSGHLARTLQHKPETPADVQLRQDPMAWLLTRNAPLFSFPHRAQLRLSPVSRAVGHYADSSDRMAVWGWNCQFYVETQLAQGISENHTQRSAIPNNMQQQYLNRYARELRQNRPAVFLDAVGNASFMLNNSSYRHENFPAIDQVIRQHYRYVLTVDNVRIYVLEDRFRVRNRLVANWLLAHTHLIAGRWKKDEGRECTSIANGDRHVHRKIERVPPTVEPHTCRQFCQTAVVLAKKKLIFADKGDGLP